MLFCIVSMHGTAPKVATNSHTVVLCTLAISASLLLQLLLQAAPAKPSLSLLELVSNPLYAKSFDASRAASPPVTARSHVPSQNNDQHAEAAEAQACCHASTCMIFALVRLCEAARLWGQAL